MQFARPESNRALYEEHFRCPVRFGATANRIVLSAETMDIPFRTNNPDLLAILVPGLEAALSPELQRSNALPLVDKVKAIIHTHMQGKRPMVEEVAGELAMSRHSLERKLGEQGTTYQRLLGQVREQIACELMGTIELDNGEIAFLLGFEELNSFNRAFSSWTGTTPLRWREISHGDAYGRRFQ